jgi:transposase
MPGYSTPTTKARICQDKAAGMHEADIAEKFGLHRTTVVRIVKRYAKSEDFYNVKPKPGRPRKFKPNDVRVAVHALAVWHALKHMTLLTYKGNISRILMPRPSERDSGHVA